MMKPTKFVADEILVLQDGRSCIRKEWPFIVHRYGSKFILMWKAPGPNNLGYEFNSATDLVMFVMGQDAPSKKIDGRDLGLDTIPVSPRKGG